MSTRPLTVKLISKPEYPLGALFYVWEQSRTNNPIPMPKQIEMVLRSQYDDIQAGTELGQAVIALSSQEADGNHDMVDVSSVRDRLWRTIEQLFDEDVPCTESVSFVFAIENMSISLREQVVRHRIGVGMDDRIGADIIPELGKSSWWSQTMRMLPMDKFASEGRYIVPESLEGRTVVCDTYEDEENPGAQTETHLIGNTEYVAKEIPAAEVYEGLMRQIQDVYGKLVEAGVPLEDARQIIPVGASHGITWTINLKALKHVLGKRACWVMQAGLWEAMISGMLNELANQVHPIFRKLALPPCFKKGSFVGCPFHEIQRERIYGRDNIAPCPIFVTKENELALRMSSACETETGAPARWTPNSFTQREDLRNWYCSKPEEVDAMMKNAERFERLWGFDVFAGGLQ